MSLLVVGNGWPLAYNEARKPECRRSMLQVGHGKGISGVSHDPCWPLKNLAAMHPHKSPSLRSLQPSLTLSIDALRDSYGSSRHVAQIC